MGMRKTAIVALIALAAAGAPLKPGISYAQMGAPGAPPAAAMASSLSPDDKAALVKKLEAARKHDRIARAGWSQEPLTQATYDKKIAEIKRVLVKLDQGEDFPLSEADKAMASPNSAPY